MIESGGFERSVIEIAGSDHEAYVQGLVTNDVSLATEGLVYAAMLTPQGKFVADFFLLHRGESMLLDVHSACKAELLKRLTIYKLRSKVSVSESSLRVSRGLGTPPEGAFKDPRHPALGWRVYGTGSKDGIGKQAWNKIRVENCIPETLVELVPESTYILEAGFERLNGVDFQKGCYVGQEVTARMKHKAKLRKGLTSVRISGSAAVGSDITANGKPIGKLYTQSGGHAIAHLRFDRARSGPLLADGAEIHLDKAVLQN